jgi:hypothetical protein
VPELKNAAEIIASGEAVIEQIVPAQMRSMLPICLEDHRKSGASI